MNRLSLSGLAPVTACRRASKRLQPYLDGELDAVSAGAVARHLGACRRCELTATTYARVKAALARTDGAPSGEPAALARLRRFTEDLLRPSGPTRTTD